MMYRLMYILPEIKPPNFAQLERWNGHSNHSGVVVLTVVYSGMFGAHMHVSFTGSLGKLTSRAMLVCAGLGQQ